MAERGVKVLDAWEYAMSNIEQARHRKAHHHHHRHLAH
jgi:hypothetical protein